MAHCILDSLAQARGRTLVGGNHHDSIVTTPSDVEAIQSKTALRKAYLGRTNLEVYIAAIAICQKEKHTNLRMAFAGGIDKYGFDTVKDIYWLSVNQKEKIKNKFIAKFNSVQSLKKYADNLEDNDLSNKILMYRHSLANTERHVQLLKERCSSQSLADVTFSTIHKAKGLEWDYVVLLGGEELSLTLEGYIAAPFAFHIPRDEINLLYVAVTRAKTLLSVNAPLLQILCLARDRMEVLVPGMDAAHKPCIICDADIDGSSTLATKVCLCLCIWARYI